MRVIAGRARSMPLKTPKSNNTRPTTDRIKETLFNVIQSEVPGSVFIDLFSGSGGIGIEALSRGAKKCYFVENEKEAIACITDNLHFTKFENESVLMKSDVFGALPMISEKEVDIIFMDPPYEAGYEENLLMSLSRMSYVTNQTLLILEADILKDFSFVSQYGFEIIKQKKYKSNQHVFLKRI